MLDSLTAKAAGLPVYVWVLIAAGGLYYFAHRQHTKRVGGPPLDAIKGEPATAPAPTAILIPYQPQHMGAFGGSNPYSGVPA